MAADLRLLVGLLVLVAIACVALTVQAVPMRRPVVTASLRAAAQLAIVAAALRGVFAVPATAVAVIAVMFTVASWTAARRLRRLDGAGYAVPLACAAGAAPVIAVIVGMPALSRDLRTLVAVCGIVFGGTMTAATLTGRRLVDGLIRRRDEVEAWLSIGATPRQAVSSIARDSAAEALVPALDQTRTVGLVTLPGAFVGALLGGASPVGAAKFQIAVLVGLLAAEAITATVLIALLGAPATLPEAEVP
jgi:putative ABC transport system permease protein